MTASEITSGVGPTVSTERSLEASVEIKVGLRSAPWLADHGFQDMTVLPGAYYVDVALRLERDRFHRDPALVRNVAFHNPIILSAEDTVLLVEVRETPDGCVEYTFYETSDRADGARL